MQNWNRFKPLKFLPPQRQHLQWILTSEEAAVTKGKYSKTKNPANYNKGNITLTILWMLTESKTASITTMIIC